MNPRRPDVVPSQAADEVPFPEVLQALVGRMKDERAPGTRVGWATSRSPWAGPPLEELAEAAAKGGMPSALADSGTAHLRFTELEEKLRRVEEDPRACARALSTASFPPAFGCHEVPDPASRAALAIAVGEMGLHGGALPVAEASLGGPLVREVVAATVLARARALTEGPAADLAPVFEPSLETDGEPSLTSRVPPPVVFAVGSAADAGRVARLLAGATQGPAEAPGRSSRAWALFLGGGPFAEGGFRVTPLANRLQEITATVEDGTREAWAQSWADAQAEFVRRDGEYRGVVGMLRAAERELISGPALQSRLTSARSAQCTAEARYGERAVAESAAAERLGRLDEEVYEADQHLAAVRQARPNLAVRLLREQQERDWIKNRRRAERQLQQRLSAADEAAAALDEARAALETARERVSGAVRTTRHARRTLEARARRLDEWKARLGESLPDPSLYDPAPESATARDTLPGALPDPATWVPPALRRAAHAVLDAAARLHDHALWHALYAPSIAGPGGDGASRLPYLVSHLEGILSGRRAPPEASNGMVSARAGRRRRPGRKARDGAGLLEGGELQAERLLGAWGLLSPVVCLAAGSVESFRLLGWLQPESLGWLVLDEQVQRGEHGDPAAFFGLAYRSRRALILEQPESLLVPLTPPALPENSPPDTP